MSPVSQRRNRSLLLLILWAVLIVLSLKDMRIAYYPESISGYIAIRLSLEGAWQEQIESVLIDPLERELRMLGEFSEIRSYSGNEKGRIILTLKEEADGEELRQKVQEITERLPLPPRARRPVIETGDQDQTPVFVAVLESECPDGMSSDKLKSAFAAVRGCGRIDTGGSEQQDLRLSLSGEQLRILGISPSDAALKLSERNSLTLIPLKGTASLSLDSRVSSPAEAGTIRVKETLEIQELGQINLVPADTESLSRLNGERKTLIWIRESGEANTISLCRSLRKITRSFEGCRIIYDRGKLIEKALREVLRTLAFSAVAVTLITAILIRKALPVLLLSLNLPFSLGGSLAIFRLLGWETDILGLAGLALSAGMIIDAGIVYLEAGYLRARGPVIWSLLSTLLVFLVFVFAPPPLFIPCRSLIVACSASLTLSALYIRTVMHGILGQTTPSEKTREIRLKPPPPRIGLPLLGVLIILSLPAAASPGIRKSVILPDPTLTFTLEYPAGMTKETLALRLKDFEKSLLDSCTLVSASYKDEKASFQLHPLENMSKKELKNRLQTSLEDENAYLHFPDENKGDGYTVRLFARDRERLYRETEKLSAKLSRLMPEERIVLHYKRRLPLINLQLQPDYPAGPAATEIYRELSRLLTSPVLGKWYPPGGLERQAVFDIRVSDPEWKNSLMALEELKIREYPPLKDIVRICRQRDYGTVEHSAGRRSVSFSIISEDNSRQQIQSRLEMILADSELPPDIRISHGQELEEQKSFRNRAFGLLLLALMLLFILLTAIFEQLKLPLILLIQLLLSELFTLAVLGLMKIPLSSPVFFALILNGGLSVNNGVLIFAPFRGRSYPFFEEALKSLEDCSLSLVSAALTTGAGLIPLLIPDKGSGGMLPALSVTVGLGIIFSLSTILLILPIVFRKKESGN